MEMSQKLEMNVRGDFKELRQIEELLQKANINVIDLYSDWVDDNRGKHILRFEVKTEAFIKLLQVGKLSGLGRHPEA